MFYVLVESKIKNPVNMTIFVEFLSQLIKQFAKFEVTVYDFETDLNITLLIILSQNAAPQGRISDAYPMDNNTEHLKHLIRDKNSELTIGKQEIIQQGILMKYQDLCMRYVRTNSRSITNRTVLTRRRQYYHFSIIFWLFIETHSLWQQFSGVPRQGQGGHVPLHST